VSKEFQSKRDDCPFPGCQGGCTGCVSVRQDRANKPYYEAALRVLARTEPIDSDVWLLAKYVRGMAKPQWGQK
jgi:hypothetical protein